MEKGTHVYVKSACENKECSCKNCQICQQKQKNLSMHCFPGTGATNDGHRTKKTTADKPQSVKKDSLKHSCKCAQCQCELCKTSENKKTHAKKATTNQSSQSIFDPDDICERHRGRKKQPDITKPIPKCPDLKSKQSKSLPPSPSASTPGRKLPKYKQPCDCYECKCNRCSYLYDKPLSLHTLADPEDICDRHRGKAKTEKKCVMQPACDCTECHCPKCQTHKKQVSLHCFTAREDKNRKETDECPLCLHIREREKKSNLLKKPSCQICVEKCVKKPKKVEIPKPVMPPCDCKQCKCKRCKDMKKKTPKYVSTGTEPDDLCDRHRGKWTKPPPKECRLCKKLKEERPPSLLNLLNPDRLCNCEVVANAVGSMKYDLAAMHPLQF